MLPKLRYWNLGYVVVEFASKMIPKSAKYASSITTSLRSIESIKIYSRPTDVSPFVDEVQRHADLEKRALGFWPAQAYRDAAAEGRLLVAIEQCGKSAPYAGHLLFSRTFPHCKVWQLYVLPKYRSRGIARRLVDALVQSLEPHNYLSIKARVASDLPANQVWERLGFPMVCQKPGGITTNRVINVRVRPLHTPTLFGIAESFGDAELPLGAPLAAGPPTYAIDLNVFFDLVRHRPRAANAATVISAGLSSMVRIVVAEEFVAELRRNAKSSGGDPVLEFASELPTVAPPPSDVLRRLTAEVQGIAFPNQVRSGSLSVQDCSDLIHIATAIHHTLTGFVTNELALLREQHQFFQRYGLRVLDVAQFADAVKASRESVVGMETRVVSGSAIVVREVSAENQESLENFLAQFPLSTELRSLFTSARPLPTRKRLVVVSANEVICAATWDSLSGLHSVADVKFVANEEHPALETGVDVLLDRICREATKKGEVFLTLELPVGHVASEAIARAKGFTQSRDAAHGRGGLLVKPCLGRAVCEKDWSSVTTWLQNVSGIALAPCLPRFIGIDGAFHFTHSSRPGQITLDKLETFLSPTIILMEDRPGVLVPIRRSFADDLLGSGMQMRLVPSRNAVLLSERVYYSSSRNVRLLKTGLPLVFYESGRDGGRSSAVAVCRIRETIVAAKAMISGQLLRYGVLDEADIEQLTVDDKIAVTTFDNLMVFQTPVLLGRLRQIGCVNEANLVAPVPISPHNLAIVVSEGKPHG